MTTNLTAVYLAEERMGGVRSTYHLVWTPPGGCRLLQEEEERMGEDCFWRGVGWDWP